MSNKHVESCNRLLVTFVQNKVMFRCIKYSVLAVHEIDFLSPE